MEGHAFKPGRHTGRRIGCAVCGQPIGDVVHVLTCAGMENADCEATEARQEQEATELTARLLEARPNIDRAAREMECSSPLFHGTGSSPTLF